MSSGPCVRQFRSRSSALVAATTGSYAPNPATGARHVKGTRGPFPPRATPRVAPTRRQPACRRRQPAGRRTRLTRSAGTAPAIRRRRCPPVPQEPGRFHQGGGGASRPWGPSWSGVGSRGRSRERGRVGATAPYGRQVRRHSPSAQAKHLERPAPGAKHADAPAPHRRLTNRYQRNVRIRIACRNRAAFARRGCTRSRNARASASSLRNRARRRRRSASQSTSPPAPSASRDARDAPADGSRSSCSGIASSPQSVPPTFPRPGGLTPAKG